MVGVAEARSAWCSFVALALDGFTRQPPPFGILACRSTSINDGMLIEDADSTGIDAGPCIRNETESLPAVA